MDIALLRTFLEVAASGSFVAASDRLFVTQSAVSLRIQRLEDALGKQLFTRSKAGADLTPEGRAFEPYALSMIKLWEECRQQVGLPEGFTRSLTIGAQYSLWPRLGFRWIDRLRDALPDLSLRAELGMPDRLTRFLIEGIVQVGLLYTPQLRLGLTAERVIEEDLILVASWPARLDEIGRDYVLVDWGPEFIQAHALELPQLAQGGLVMALGALAAQFVMRRRAAAYLPARYVALLIDEGRLHPVPDAPHFPFPVWAVWRDDLDPDLRAVAGRTLALAAAHSEAEQTEVLGTLSRGAAILGRGAGSKNKKYSR